jgi:hypothetical protein
MARRYNNDGIGGRDLDPRKYFSPEELEREEKIHKRRGANYGGMVFAVIATSLLLGGVLYFDYRKDNPRKDNPRPAQVDSLAARAAGSDTLDTIRP